MRRSGANDRKIQIDHRLCQAGQRDGQPLDTRNDGSDAPWIGPCGPHPSWSGLGTTLDRRLHPARAVASDVATGKDRARPREGDHHRALDRRGTWCRAATLRLDPTIQIWTRPS